MRAEGARPVGPVAPASRTIRGLCNSLDVLWHPLADARAKNLGRLDRPWRGLRPQRFCMSSLTQAGLLPQLAKYDIVEEVGHGGMATVYRARDRRLDRDVAIKIIHKHLRESPEVAARFEAEARAVAKLRHPNIVEVYDVSEPEDPEKYLVVELLRGTTLRRILTEVPEMPPEVAAAIGIELGSALAHAHGAGVIHRDLKPENVLIEI